ncbi:Uncharacterised protein [Nocardia otitidiscaviarum]|uniref:Uncharacterized protein n=2 Tax=Nocardia otitidiscaviarum TaxID=1823 RepID=A0A378YQ17_9NOCA|nr:Uncharacterised protein [Nocardia otitidiscaviarum]
MLSGRLVETGRACSGLHVRNYDIGTECEAEFRDRVSETGLNIGGEVTKVVSPV